MTERRTAVRAAVVMPKGGVGKTATAAALAWGLKEQKKRTLVIDLDPQMADLSLVLGVDKVKAEYTSREIMLHPERVFAPVKLDEFLDLVPADPDPVLTEMRLGKETMVSGPVKLRRALDRVEDRYDFILCDCRPGGGAVMANALVACRHIVAPVQLTRFAASCIVELNTILSEVFDGQARPDIRYLPTFWTSDRETAEALEFVEENCRGALYETRIPRAVAIARARRSPPRGRTPTTSGPPAEPVQPRRGERASPGRGPLRDGLPDHLPAPAGRKLVGGAARLCGMA